MVTARILSNVEVHGLQFAVDQEQNRLMRKGFSRRVAWVMATRMVVQVL